MADEGSEQFEEQVADDLAFEEPKEEEEEEDEEEEAEFIDEVGSDVPKRSSVKPSIKGKKSIKRTSSIPSSKKEEKVKMGDQSRIGDQAKREQKVSYVWAPPIESRVAKHPSFSPCPHIFFKETVVPRDRLRHNEYITLLAKPSRTPWLQSTCEPDLVRYKRKKVTARTIRLAFPKLIYIKALLCQLECMPDLFDPKLIENLRKLLLAWQESLGLLDEEFEKPRKPRRRRKKKKKVEEVQFEEDNYKHLTNKELTSIRGSFVASRDLKEWAWWIDGVAKLAKDWCRWIKEAVDFAEHLNNKKRGKVTNSRGDIARFSKTEWCSWAKAINQGAQEWFGKKKEAKATAEKWKNFTFGRPVRRAGGDPSKYEGKEEAAEHLIAVEQLGSFTQSRSPKSAGSPRSPGGSYKSATSPKSFASPAVSGTPQSNRSRRLSQEEPPDI